MPPAAATSRPTPQPLAGPWFLCAHPPNSIAHPDQLATAVWKPALVPGTVASSLAALGDWSLDRPLDADAHDWFYRTTFTVPDRASGRLTFAGLATLAEVWLNGQQVLTADNMFRSYAVDVHDKLRSTNDLVIAFRSLDHALSQKRPRPRWKTNLVAHQQLRWLRTSLLGRIPGWSPPAPPVGPWRGIHLDLSDARFTDVRLATAIANRTGIVKLSARCDAPLERVTFRVGNHHVPAKRSDSHWRAEIHFPDAPLWWPHTHGVQPLLDASLEFDRGSVPLGRVGFRTIEQTQDRFALRINGEPVYCRGACWTVSDIVSLHDPAVLERDLRLAKAAGVNMLRVGGTMIYEADEFYRLCDELGILVWQDFMFANMDYPAEDAAFAANIHAEATEQLTRLASHPSVAVVCGNSEVEQQAAMLGMPEELWRNAFFGQRLPELCRELHPQAIYVPSTPSGGTLPFHLREGVAHYYGVGAYQRLPADVRQDDVAFSPECLGFANVPDQATLGMLGDSIAPHDPRWKQRVPRDTGPGWDFDDVRDFYLRTLFAVDPVRLRSFDPTRYLQLSRVVPGEMMAQVFAEWRGSHSRNAGGLVWFFKDLWPGAGWGIVDSLGRPKATYYFLKRVWQPRQIVATNEGLDGIHLHVINETAETFTGSVELVLLKDNHIVVARQNAAVEVVARSTQTLSGDALLRGFYDIAYAYRFGPPKHDVAIATLLDVDGQPISEFCLFPVPREPAVLDSVNVTAIATPRGDGFDVTLTTDRFLHSLSFDLKGLHPVDNYFHLTPLRPKTVHLTPIAGATVKTSGYVEALNLRTPTKIMFETAARP